MQRPFIELTILKNNLINERYGKADIQTISNETEKLKNWDSPFSEILMEGLNNIKQDVDNGNFKSAITEAIFIHNFPSDNEAINEWDQRHFYCIELPCYVREVEDYKRLRQMIRLIAALDVDEFDQSS